ncbi:hypothetical protein [Actinoplanes sp. RD1]|uniref:hypothetical protein n=1 Tax=Actinoplanes sp. RD1 TaxID=3064538 RepID=UPI00274298E6|nr:hypothetical protein [Actinoplanes sp. RD1]
MVRCAAAVPPAAAPAAPGGAVPPAAAPATPGAGGVDGLRTRLSELAAGYAAVRDDPASAPEDLRAAFYRFHAVRAVAAALGPDPAEAAWQACYRAASAIGGDFDDQLRLEVLRRLVERARSGLRNRR